MPILPESAREKASVSFDVLLIAATAVFLVGDFFFHIAWVNDVLASLSFIGLIPVALSAFKSLAKRQVSVDLLASIALVFALMAHEWSPAAFITLMLAFARVLG